MFRKPMSVLLLALLVGCAALGGPPLILGVTTQAEVIASKGPPALSVEEAGGTRRLFWTTSPGGTSTIMGRFNAQGRLLSYEEVLDMTHFANIQPGMSMDDVKREIGPSFPGWTTYFERQNQLIWEWRYCDSWNAASRFDVIFDGTTKKVLSTQSQTEAQLYGTRVSPTCGYPYIRVEPGTASVK
jgi:hypothetical protein